MVALSAVLGKKAYYNFIFVSFLQCDIIAVLVLDMCLYKGCTYFCHQLTATSNYFLDFALFPNIYKILNNGISSALELT